MITTGRGPYALMGIFIIALGMIATIMLLIQVYKAFQRREQHAAIDGVLALLTIFGYREAAKAVEEIMTKDVIVKVKYAKSTSDRDDEAGDHK